MDSIASRRRTDTAALSKGYVVRLADWLAVRRGWRRLALAFLLGALATAALPPVYLIPFVVVAFTGLVWMLDGVDGAARQRAWRGFAVGWTFGFGHFVTGLYWIAHALLIDAAQFGWMIPFAVGGLSAGLAVFPGLAAGAVTLIRWRGAPAALLLAVAWGGAEWLRGHVLTGFPWNLIGTVWTESEPMLQTAALVGAYGLGMLTVAMAALPASLARPGSGWRRWMGSGAAAALLAALWTGGAIRLGAAEAEIVPGVRLRLVQPDIPQSLKWDPALRERHLQKTMEVTAGPGFATRTHVIWPETAVPFTLSNNASLRQVLTTVVPRGGLLITGAPRVAERAGGGIEAWNSLHALDGAGDIVATYDKFHLVPFGEYVPLRGILDIAKVTPGNIDFSAGPGPRTIPLPGLPSVSPLVCYEVIFPANVVASGERPGWILNVTNDAWYGISAGPYQHFATARFRAVEEGLPLVRAANNGISAVIDPYGRVVARLGLGRMGVVDSDLPRAIAPPPYARFGDALPAGLAAVLLLVAWGLRARAAAYSR